jgi:hypothetical protein
MSIEKALIPQPNGPQWLQTDITIANGDIPTLTCKFASVRDDESVIVNHASCIVDYPKRHSAGRLGELASTARAGIEHLRAGITTGRSYCFNSNMIYRMVATKLRHPPTHPLRGDFSWVYVH